MNKELEALKRLFEHCENHIEDNYYEYDIDIEDYKLIQSTLERAEKLEQVWKLILEKEVNITDVRESIFTFDMTYKHYVNYYKNYSWQLLTEEEFDFIKKMIKDDFNGL